MSTTIKQIVKFDYCCKEMQDMMEGPLNAVHIAELKIEKDIGPVYMNVETQDGSCLPCFLKFCPECGTELSKNRWRKDTSSTE